MSSRSRTYFLPMLVACLLLSGWNYPIEIAGEGDVTSLSGSRDCLLEEYQAGLPNCSENDVVGNYVETYTASARPGFRFNGWGACQVEEANQCSFDAAARVSTESCYADPPLVAYFRQIIDHGYNMIMVGHSFVSPYYDGMESHAKLAGYTDHAQLNHYYAGRTGAPAIILENATKKAEVEASLDIGGYDLFGMIYYPIEPAEKNLDGYRYWIDYALQSSPDVSFFIALPWHRFPQDYTAAEFEAAYRHRHETVLHPIIDILRSENPGMNIFCIPYGRAGVELKLLWEAGNLPEIENHTEVPHGVFSDKKGHPSYIGVALGELLFLNALYDVDLEQYDHDTGYDADLTSIAVEIMERHDHRYDSR